MAESLDHAYECDANWKGPELASSSEWIYRLTENDIAELETALRQIKSRGLEIPAIRQQDFPLPTFSKKLAGVLQELECGRGFTLMRGIPVEAAALEESESADADYSA